MNDSTAPTDSRIPDTEDDNYVQLQGLSKEWRKRYRHAKHQREELETLLKRLEEERRLAQMEQEQLEERSRLELEQEKKALDLQVC
ncbi:Hypp5789 [Branchiostoma lanceolatum]|uniref:Hypp5789 protein n=1 Tax=Branchiostoma lanceolatum TaxID=7740 RepID=A0A8J9W7F5_BRALA|nr:Hypp5789 [Branchiostoma lanceolatum]